MTPQQSPADRFDIALATNDADVHAAQRLRYQVFIKELNGDSPHLDHGSKREVDPFDATAQHLILRDLSRANGEEVIGTYRLISSDQTIGAAFSSQAEYDLSKLISSGKHLLELSRSCVHPDYRDGRAMFALWRALSDYVQSQNVDILFGVASFHGRDPKSVADALSLLHHRHLAPADLRPISRKPAAFDLIAENDLDRTAAMLKIPTLIKAYLRLGGAVGEGAFVDTAFNTVDVCMVVDMTNVSARQRAIYGKGVT